MSALERFVTYQAENVGHADEDARLEWECLIAEMCDEDAKLRELVCHLYYAKPRDVTSILVNGEVLDFDKLMAEVGLRWEDA